MANVTVDTTGMSSPAPLLKTKQTLDTLPAGSLGVKAVFEFNAVSLGRGWAYDAM